MKAYKASLVKLVVDLILNHSDEKVDSSTVSFPFKPPGVKTLGGVNNAEQRFDKALVDMYNLENSSFADVVRRAHLLATEIVTDHVFENANGRAAIYVIYYELANWGWKLNLKVLLLHSYLFTNSQRDRVPGVGYLIGLLSQYTVRLSNDGAMAHMKNIRSQLQKLEKRRSSVSRLEHKPFLRLDDQLRLTQWQYMRGRSGMDIRSEDKKLTSCAATSANSSSATTSSASSSSMGSLAAASANSMVTFTSATSSAISAPMTAASSSASTSAFSSGSTTPGNGNPGGSDRPG